MNAQGILERIERDARAAAAATLEEARRKADAMRAESEQKIEQARAQTLAEAAREADAMRDRMVRMAKLETRKADLAAKRETLEEAFVLAREKLAAMPEADARAFGLKTLLSAAKGTETVIADEASAWCDARFVAEANRALVAEGKPGALTLAAEQRRLGGGFSLSSRGLEINCSYQAMVDALRMDLEAEVAALLFA